jgi:purine-nucleoside phosphorylase
MNSSPAVAFVAGSGLDLTGLFDQITEEIPFEDVPGLSGSTVPGHSGRFRMGTVGEQPVIVQCGRRHFYEGCDYGAVTASVDALADFGARYIVFTNAAGGLRPEMVPGDLMAVESVAVRSYAGWPDAPESIMPSMVLPGCAHQGAYVWVHGPSYETRAEIRAFQTLGGAAVGMSTAPELVRSTELGLKTAAISCITNNCCRPSLLTHEHVVDTARQASADLTGLLREAIPTILARP